MPNLGVKSLGILLGRGPGTPEAGWAAGLARAAAERGDRARVFLMHDGVDHLAGPDLDAFLAPGISVTVCSQTAIARGLLPDRPEIDYASQIQLAFLVGETDRFVSLT